MNATLEDVTNKKQEPTAEQLAAEEMVRRAREQGLSLTGPDGLLKQLTKTVLETALSQEMTEHLGHEKHGRPVTGSGNVRNGTRPKTVLTEGTGQVGIEVPRDRDGSFEPQIVKKRQRRLTGAGEIVLSLYAKGLTTGEISAHSGEIYGASVSRETISRITDKVIEEMQSWQARPLDQIYAAVFIDAIVVKVRDGQVANRPVYAAIGVSLAGEKDILGLWAGTGGEGAKFWMSVLTDIRNRGVRDVFFLVCDGLKGLPEVVGNVWPLATVQTCIIHLIRNTFRLASKRDWDALKRDIKPVYTAVNAAAARDAMDQVTETWGSRYGAIIRLWENAWEQFVPFLDYDVEIRTVLCSTNAIESLNARYRRAVKARGHFPTEQAGWIQPVNATPCLRGEVHDLGSPSDSGGDSAAVLVADPGGRGPRRCSGRRGRVENRYVAMVPKCWRGDAAR
jgi:putative transposase